MTFGTFDALVLTILFAVPGFIWWWVHGALVPRRPTDVQVRLLGFLALSCVNNAIWSPLLAFVFATGFFGQHPIGAAAILIIPTLLSPIAAGLLTGRAYQREWPARCFARFGLGTVHQIPTAWDYQFSRQLPFWIVVTLKDNSRVFGLFHAHSFAGDDPAERDLYIERVYAPDEHGAWLPVQGSAGILIKASSIAAIEFLRLQEIDYGDQ